VGPAEHVQIQQERAARGVKDAAVEI